MFHHAPRYDHRWESNQKTCSITMLGKVACCCHIISDFSRIATLKVWYLAISPKNALNCTHKIWPKSCGDADVGLWWQSAIDFLFSDETKGVTPSETSSHLDTGYVRFILLERFAAQFLRKLHRSYDIGWRVKRLYLGTKKFPTDCQAILLWIGWCFFVKFHV